MLVVSLLLWLSGSDIAAPFDEQSQGLADSPVVQLAACDREGEEKGHLPYIYESQCGRLEVPENHQQPEKSREISLTFMRISAISSNAREPLFVIAGGPGQSSIEIASQVLPFFREVQINHDMVFVDQRGTGQSNGLSCFIDPTEEAALPEEQLVKRQIERFRDCIRSYDADLNFYSTPHAVRDLELVRRAMGYKSIHLWGVSYGTRVILEYMRQYPQSLKSVVMDGVAPVAMRLPQNVESDGNRSLDLVLSNCEASEPCRKAYGNLREVWHQLLDRLAQQTSTTTLVNPRSQEPVTVLLSERVLSQWVQMVLYSRELMPILPRAMHFAAVKNDFSLLGGLALLGAADMSEHISHGMHMAVLCSEDYRYPAQQDLLHQNLVQQIAVQRQSLLRMRNENYFSALCAEFPRGNVPLEYFQPFSSEIPTLLLSGQYDPITPPKWAERVAGQLSNAQHVVVQGAHHNVTPHGCVRELIAQFLLSDKPLPLDASCAENVRSQRFFIDGAGPVLGELEGD